MKTKDLLKKIDHDRVIRAIRDAEARTSGEVRVFVSTTKPTDPVAAARAEFVRLNMHQTAERNGVLLFIAPRSQGLAIVGDTAVHEHIGDTGWRRIIDAMLARCREGQFTEALLYGIEQVAGVLAEHSPRKHDDRNELSDKVETG